MSICQQQVRVGEAKIHNGIPIRCEALSGDYSIFECINERMTQRIKLLSVNNDDLAIRDKRARQLEQPFVAPGALLEPNAQLPEAVEPREPPLHDPAARRAAPSAQRGP